MRLLGQAFDGTAQVGSGLPILYDEYGIESVVNPEKAALYSGTEPVTTRPVEEAAQAVAYAQALRMAYCQSNVAGVLLFHSSDETALAGLAVGRVLVGRVEEEDAGDVRLAVRHPHRLRVVTACVGSSTGRVVAGSVPLYSDAFSGVRRLDPVLVVEDRQRRPRLGGAVEGLAEQPDELPVVGETEWSVSEGARSTGDGSSCRRTGGTRSPSMTGVVRPLARYASPRSRMNPSASACRGRCRAGRRRAGRVPRPRSGRRVPRLQRVVGLREQRQVRGAARPAVRAELRQPEAVQVRLVADDRSRGSAGTRVGRGRVRGELGVRLRVSGVVLRADVVDREEDPDRRASSAAAARCSSAAELVARSARGLAGPQWVITDGAESPASFSQVDRAPSPSEGSARATSSSATPSGSGPPAAPPDERQGRDSGDPRQSRPAYGLHG